MSKSQVWSSDGSLKRCSKCATFKPPDDFHRRKLKSGGFGLTSWCKACSRALALECANRRYKEDAEWREAKLAKDRSNGMQKRLAYRAEHPRVFLTPEERLERTRASHRKTARRPEYRERQLIRARNIRALKRCEVVGDVITKEAWKKVLEEHDHRCTYCGVQTEFLEMDHVIPLSRGGRHVLENVTPACRSCNTTKNDRLPGEWTPPSEPQKIIRAKGGRNCWKLTDEQVVEIRRRRAAGERGRALAKEFGVHEQHISDIYRGKQRRVLLPPTST